VATLQARRLGYHSRAGLEPENSRFSTLCINHYDARGIAETGHADGDRSAELSNANKSSARILETTDNRASPETGHAGFVSTHPATVETKPSPATVWLPLPGHPAKVGPDGPATRPQYSSATSCAGDAWRQPCVAPRVPACPPPPDLRITRPSDGLNTRGRQVQETAGVQARP
jgi:hypothetical protein